MKTVTFDDEAYDLLRAAKLAPDESFSKVVKRLLGASPSGWRQVFGAWGDKPLDEVAATRRAARDAFGWTGDSPEARRDRR